ncbi:MAG: helix-turn-helix domain-containing protein [Gammaproteobacteria bacterium]|nr:helix-turn-helix domain-containing protein [Gammaproteobacteria bacterium]
MDPNTAIYLGTVAAISLILKCTILLNIRIDSRTSQAFVVVCLFFVAQNAGEFLAYLIYLKSEAVGKLFAHIYIVAAYFMISSVLIFTLALTESRYYKLAQVVLYSCSVVLSIGYMNGMLVDGLIFLGWTVIANPGQFYGFGTGYMLSCCAAIVGCLWYHGVYNTDLEIRHNAKAAMVAFLPILLVAVAVYGLRLLGFNSSSAVSLPIATLLFLYVLLLHTNGTLFWFSAKLRSILAILKIKHDVPMDAIIEELERVRIHQAMKISHGRQKQAAELLGMSASTLSKRLSKYAINADFYRQNSRPY